MFSCLPKCVYSAILSHKEWTSFWGAGHSLPTTAEPMTDRDVAELYLNDASLPTTAKGCGFVAQ